MNRIKYKGFIFTVIYYLVGLLSGYVVYRIFGWEYIHAPGFHHLTYLLFLVVGLIWAIVSLVLLFRNNKRFYRESLLVHAIVFGLLFIWIFAGFLNSGKHTSKAGSEKEKTMLLINSGDTSLLVNEKKDTIYLKIRDSILIDHFESSFPK